MQPSLRGSAVDGAGRGLPGVQITNNLKPGASVTDENGRWAIFFSLDQAELDCDVTATSSFGSLPKKTAHIKRGQTVIVERFQFS
jgi:hypothetical protein